MRYDTIADIYSANQKAREGLIATLGSISEDEATALPDGEKWSIQKIAEHLALVDHGISRLCARLLEGAKAIGKTSDGTVTLSAHFIELSEPVGEVKVEAPERVQPTGEVTIAEAMERIEANCTAFESLREDLESYDASEPTFPHPYFGEISAVEWMIVAGAHEERHVAQIERLLAKIRR